MQKEESSVHRLLVVEWIWKASLEIQGLFADISIVSIDEE